MMVTVTVLHKRNRQTLYKPLDERIRRMLQLCADDIGLSFKGTIRVIFQTGASRAQRRLLGLCCFFHHPAPTIYIYTRYQRIKTILSTIAHEFGHVSHFVLYPESATHWCNTYRETFADKYAEIMMQRWNGVTGC